MPNNLLHLKGRFEGRANPSQGGGLSWSKSEVLHCSHIAELQDQLQNIILPYWSEHSNIINGILVSVCYTRTIPKSRRIAKLFSLHGEPSNDSIVGAKYSDDIEKKHVITHHINTEIAERAILALSRCEKILREDGVDTIDHNIFTSYQEDSDRFTSSGISKSKFLQTLIDIGLVERFIIPEPDYNFFNDRQSLVSLYSLKGVDYQEILPNILGIPQSQLNKITDETFLLYPHEIEKLRDTAPFLIAMSVNDMTKVAIEEQSEHLPSMDKNMEIPAPQNEPIVGVIDGRFDATTYISEWVQYDGSRADHPDDDDNNSLKHGTGVTSLVVDGPALNPMLDDGCGRFRVRHFGVYATKEVSTAKIMHDIEEIIKSNRDIKIWNLSLGSTRGVNSNFISPEGALIDQLQNKYGVLFVIAGTNIDEKTDDQNKHKIGAPADSINAITVNATNRAGEPASYSRQGNVLSFFVKPDVCCFGGDGGSIQEAMQIRVGNKSFFPQGTSFAAPWVTRKMAYLTEKMGLSREIAKALVIDSAIGWNSFDLEKSYKMGYGEVPQRIEDILVSAKDEIKFCIEGVADQYEKYNFKIPVPMKDGRYPFMIRATMCYFPECSRSQGVDYTNTELDLYIGRPRVKKTKKKLSTGEEYINTSVSMLSINQDNQSHESAGIHPNEYQARRLFRKWDNVKHIKQITKMPLSPFDYQTWGIKICAKERLGTANSKTRFGVVVTLKEINGENRYDDFIRQCILNGWIVNAIDMHVMNRVYAQSELEINLDDMESE